MFRSRLHQQTCAACRLHQAIAAKQSARCRNANATRRQISTRLHSSRTPFIKASSFTTQRIIGNSPNIARFHTTQHHEPPSQDAAEQATPSKNDIVEQAPLAEDVDTLEEVEYIDSVELPSLEGLTTEEAVHVLRQTYGDRLPDGLLDEEQGLVWERLYGRPLKTVQELDIGDEDDVDDTSGVMKMRDGNWEEVELDEEADDQLGDMRDGDRQLQEDIEAAMEDEVDDIDETDDEFVPGAPSVSKLHPLTIANSFSTSPATLQPPKDTLTDLISILLGSVSPKHVSSAAHRIFGGFGLPHSTSTPRLGKVQQQTSIPLDVSQYRMSDIEADVYMAVIMTAVYASTMSVLVETRKRLGTAWAEGLVRKAEAGKLHILDAGGAGMGVLAVRDMLKAEWERMHEDAVSPGGGAVATADGKIGGAGVAPPSGNATVFIASEALRHRASHILVNTTFVPRMPDYAHTTEAKQAGKYDIVIAPHTIWPIREAYLRKAHVSNLWSLTNADGGVLCMIEKGVARGFEAIAAARQQLLRTNIASSDVVAEEVPDLEDTPNDTTSAGFSESAKKEAGMIIAPCTNHTACPMYKGSMQGTIKGRKDFCHFKQRYIRPPFLQKILGAKDKNFEDVKISYLSVMRGGDLRATKQRHEMFKDEPLAMQGAEATDKAFEGYAAVEDDPESDDNTAAQTEDVARPSSLSLPRTVLAPLKRRGHVILDMCTPAGNIERWTVPRSYSKQAFHDARKSDWGDLWALGAKTRVDRTVKLGKHARREGPRELSSKMKKEKRRIKERKAGKQGMLNKSEAS